MEKVWWHPWDESAFEKAHREHKPILLWITYRGCRACTQMAEESFSEVAVVRALQQNFVAIEVDREEHPDIDRHFQRVFSLMLGKEEGWPLTLFLAPDTTPLYVAAYVPPVARDGMMGMETLLDLIAKKYADDPDGFVQKGQEALAHLMPPRQVEATQINLRALGKTLRQQTLEAHDTEYGGYGEAPKQLHVALLKAVLSLHELEGEAASLHSVQHTLDALLVAPIWDHEEGGFYCCTLDREWQIPQQRKGVAKNAIMAMILMQADVLSVGETPYRDAAYRICDWALAQMHDAETGLWMTGIIDGKHDDRIFAASNAFMTQALLQAARTEERYRPEALGALNRLMEKMASNLQIQHQYGRKDTVTYLVDYAALASALLAAYDLTGNQQFVATAGEYASAAIRRFYDQGRWAVGDGQWRDPMVFVDSMLPSAAATITMVLTRLAVLLDRDYRPFVDQTLAVASYELMRRPITKAGMAEAAMLALGN